MKVKRTLVKNFLNKPRHHYGVVVSLGILALSLFLSMQYWQGEWGSILSASPELVFNRHEYWRLFTTSFIHGDLAHYLSNSLMLALMGYFVATYYGLWIFPSLSFTVGGLLNYLVLLTHENHVSLVGASGVVYLLWGFWLINYILIQRHIKLNRRFMKVVAISLMVLIPTSYQANVSYLAHFLGFVLGVLTGFLYFYFNKEMIFSKEEYHYEVEEDDPPWGIEEEESNPPLLH